MGTIYPLFIFLFICIFNNGFAKTVKFPKGCESIGYEFNNKEVNFLTYQEQALYFIYNPGQKIIKLSSGKSESNIIDLGWCINLKPKRWAAIAINSEDLKMHCELESISTSQLQRCSNAIEICQYPRAKFTLSNQGTYWIAKNDHLKKAMSKAIKRGILLSW